ncbi:hypothetical protein TESG_08273 [Trichophyton tonsurans CBS 112818]|uniref:Uncharacterized protein n=2 Tax=Trichophyton TaxID=5550 RepID=F2PZX9_TRIEC|nr:hypothetical protein TESG_08273 [Trichophyton tonsurans CBS 112818]EGE07447.1 hypothetical protein TEQG_08759 [Trichophyton equinum CBS 127.97]
MATIAEALAAQQQYQIQMLVGRNQGNANNKDVASSSHFYHPHTKLLEDHVFQLDRLDLESSPTTYGRDS